MQEYPVGQAQAELRACVCVRACVRARACVRPRPTMVFGESIVYSLIGSRVFADVRRPVRAEGGGGSGGYLSSLMRAEVILGGLASALAAFAIWWLLDRQS